MKNSFLILFVNLLALTMAGCSSAEESKESVPAPAAPTQPLTAEDAVLVSVTAKIEALNQQTREVTLRGPEGNVVSFVVDPAVKRLAEFKVGDSVTAEYYVSIAAELREPTAEERANPLVALDVLAKAPPGTSPAGGGLRAFRILATVEAVDVPTLAVTLKGPRGNYLTVRARDVKKVKQLKVGDTIVIVYTEALAIGLTKTGA